MKKHHGFTLIEVLMALTLFAILAAMTSSSMYYAFNTRTRVSAQTDCLNALQLTLSLIQQDTKAIIARPIRGNEFHLFPAFIGRPYYIELTRGGLPNPHGEEQRSTLTRIAWFCKDNQLIRRSWPRLDLPHRDTFEDKVLLNNLDDCHFGFLDENLQLLHEWQIQRVPNAPTMKLFPKAIQLNLALPDWGKGTFLFIIPEALYDNV